MQQVIFSVIIPVYNRQASVGRAIESVLKQSFGSFELILVDDCSTDQSVEVIKSFKDERIKLLQLPQNKGAAAARNAGIVASKGTFISFLDSDDEYEPAMLEEAYELFEQSNESTGFLWTGIRFVNGPQSKELVWQPVFIESNYISFLHSLHIGTNSGISVKRNVFEVCGYFNESLPAAEDTDFFLRITQKFEYVNSNKILIRVNRDGADRLSKNYSRIAKAYNLFLPAHFPVIDRYHRLVKKFYYKMMWLNYHLNDKAAARIYFKKLVAKKAIDFKSCAVALLFELLPLQLAKKVHLKISNIS
jgi:glycosyltransferase involved in cell wall biosynthesis